MRMSIRDLEKEENKEQRYAFLRAWKGIKELDPSDENSFWSIASYHGKPFDKPGKVEGGWGGYCQHQNVLFPLWHRYYVLKIENALQSIEPTAAMHYWDQTSDESRKNGIPDLLMDTEVVMDDSGTKQPNPLINYKFQMAISAEDNNQYYQKDIGYVTVRYPFSGICYPEDAAEKANQHNAKMHENHSTDKDKKNVLNNNVIRALKNDDSSVNIQKLYEQCIQAPTYNIFSNTESAGITIEQKALEDPHNKIHLAIGGFDLECGFNSECNLKGDHSGLIRGANGDMGQNETASFDPIFFIHHCNVDRVFWVWQKKHAATIELDIISDKSDPGITPAAGQGPTPHQEIDEILTLDTPLYPFKNSDGKVLTGRQCINIADLGYDYTQGSLTDIVVNLIKVARVDDLKEQKEIDEFMKKEEMRPKSYEEKSGKETFYFNLTDFKSIDECCGRYKAADKWNYQMYLKVEDIPRDKYPGSFIVKAYYHAGVGKIFIGRTCVMDRWQRKKCKNCQSHRYTTATFKLNPAVISNHPKLEDYTVEIEYHSPKDGSTQIAIHDMRSKIRNGKVSGKFFLSADINK